jgi:hypothetical protein
VLNLTPDQEAYLDAWFRSVQKKDYGRISNNCGQPIQDALRDMGVRIPDSTLPLQLERSLYVPARARAHDLEIAIAGTNYPYLGDFA